MFILQIGAHKKRKNILKVPYNYAKIKRHDGLGFPMLRKGVH